jgi:Tat protein translocase TatB subunit
LNLFGIGPGELLLILILAFIIFGPRQLPEIGRTLGKTMRELRQVSDELTGQFREELEAASEDLETIKKAATEELETVTKAMSGDLQSATGELESATQEAAGELQVSSEDLAREVAAAEEDDKTEQEEE